MSHLIATRAEAHRAHQLLVRRGEFLVAHQLLQAMRQDRATLPASWTLTVCIELARTAREDTPPYRMRFRAYWVRYTGSDWGCTVVAPTARAARTVFHAQTPERAGDFIDIRATWLADVSVPEHLNATALFDECQTWECAGFTRHIGCDHCRLGATKPHQEDS